MKFKIKYLGCLVIIVSCSLLLVGCQSAIEKALQSINTPPAIQSLSATPSSVNTENTAVLNCVAVDADDDTLNYTWLPTGGTLLSNVGSSVSWIAPATSGIYSITVKVSDGKDTTSGSLSIPVSSANDATAPNAPTGLSASAGNELIVLSWNANTETDLKGYNVHRSTTSGSGFIKINNSVVQAVSYIDSDLTNGTTYYYKITAQDTSGNESSYSSEVNAAPTSTNVDTEKPSAPSDLSAAAGITAIDLSWTANTESDLAGYKIYQSTTSGSDYTVIATVGKTTQYQDGLVQSNITYYYAITALDLSNNESEKSSEVSVKTSTAPPSAPAGLSASSVTADSAQISWSSVSDATSYTLSYGTDTSASNVGTVGTTETSYSLADLTSNTTYYIKILASNSGGSSAYSDAANFTTTLVGATTTTTTSTTTTTVPGATTTTVPGATTTTTTSTTTSTTTTTVPIFSIETIEANNQVSGFPYTSIHSSNGTTYFAYAAALSQNHFALKYAKWDGSSWSKSTIDTKDDEGYYDLRPDIILSDSSPQIYYCTYPSTTSVGGSNMVLKRASLEGVSWQTGDLMSATRKCSVVLDSSGNPHLLFPNTSSSGSGSSMYYLVWTGSNWQTEEITEASIGGGGLYYYTLALDSNDNPHFSFFTNDTQLIKYATKDSSGSWNVETIDTTGTGYYNDLAVDSNNRPHIVYVDNADDELIYAYYDGSSWQKVILGESMLGGYGSHPYGACSLALDSNNKAHIAYGMGNTLASYTFKLKYATISGNTIETNMLIVDNAICINDVNISLDSNSKPHIVYSYSKTIKYTYMN